MRTIDPARVEHALAQELERFTAEHPRSKALYEQAQANLLDGVPMNWMVRWAGAFPVFVSEAKGPYFTDVDGHRYLDFCLGDTGAMTGHSPQATVEAIIQQAQAGLTLMLPTEDAIWVGQELERRFGLPDWQTTLTATDANRFAIRLARHITGRPYVLVYNWCYHGTVDESFITLDENGIPGPRPGNIGPPVNPAVTTKVIEFNDLPALEAALAPGDVACVLAEPVMTNIGIVHPDPGYHDALHEITRRTGTLLIIDETHTICTGPGGYTGAHGLKPDMLTLGKPVGSGIPGAVYGFSREVGEKIRVSIERELADVGGIGGTLAGNALSVAAMKATLQHVLTQAAYDQTIPLAERFTAGVESVIAEMELPWIVKRLGCRAEYWFRATPPRNGGEAAAAVDAELERYMHLAALNRGILMTPFHNMALIAPGTTEADIDYHTQVFRESVAALL
ncbi:MAG: aspartate aminotransferase family protein [Anaerolineae bacterium]